MFDSLPAYCPLLAQQVPEFANATYWFLIAMRVLHMLGAAIIVGGLIYLCSVATPAAASADSADAQLGGRRTSWAMLVGIATLLLLGSGLFNYIYLVKTHEKMPTSYHMLFGLKFLAGLVVFFLAALISGRTNLAQQIRQNIRYWLNVCLVLSLAILILGSVMRTYPRAMKGAAPQALPPNGERINP